MKIFYGLEGDVTHNSLNDAIDLCHIFEAFQSKKEICEEAVLKFQK